MKKITICFIIVILLTATLFRIDSVQLLKKLTLTDIGLPANQLNLETKSEKKKEKDSFVRIVLLNPSNQTIYHTKLNVSSSNMYVYYGKNFATKKQINQIDIETSSKYFKQNSLIKIEAKKSIKINSMGEVQKYPGSLYIYKENSGLVVVNQVSLEDYVSAVISSEIGVDAPKEALKAQAVCARTYICNAKPKHYKKYNAVADDSTDYQVYNKVYPNDECIKASEDTKGLVMMNNLKPIKAYYFSTSCGYTTNYRIWGREKISYLKGCEVAKKKEHLNISNEKVFHEFIKSDGNGYEKKCPYYRWNTYMTSAQIETSVYSYVGVNIGHFENIEVNERGVGGIASQITIYGDLKQVVINNQTQIRKVLSSMYMILKLNDGTQKKGVLLLPSAFISVETVYNGRSVSGLKIYGGGFGHGSGMSQNGAIEMAKDGMNYESILNTFYDNVKIQKYSK